MVTPAERGITEGQAESSRILEASPEQPEPRTLVLDMDPQAGEQETVVFGAPVTAPEVAVQGLLA
jgi:hypothetical protein